MDYNVMLGIAWVTAALMISILLAIFVAAYEKMKYYRAMFGKEKAQRKTYWNTINKQNGRIVELKNKVSYMDKELCAAEKLVEMQAEELNNLEKEPYRATLETKLKEIQGLQGELQKANARVKIMENQQKCNEEEMKKLSEEYAFFRSALQTVYPLHAAVVDSEILCSIEGSYVAEMIRDEVMANEKPASAATDTGTSQKLAERAEKQQISACV